ncbi:small ubiquitin-related modifier 2-like [Lutra lutra]|uniref:small ubiquitin-related modifier 2-like n=1 Tax=Lutra lutra TaxID=9657 RepID=UPI001FCFB43E|nr:small ubiquitin-related modifier 2-like [Lutra lutra]
MKWQLRRPVLSDVDEKPKEGDKAENVVIINLKVVWQDGSVVQFKIKWHISLNNLLRAYCERKDLSLEMGDEDTIDGIKQQTGVVY